MRSFSPAMTSVGHLISLRRSMSLISDEVRLFPEYVSAEPHAHFADSSDEIAIECSPRIQRFLDGPPTQSFERLIDQFYGGCFPLRLLDRIGARRRGNEDKGAHPTRDQPCDFSGDVTSH